MKRVQLHTDGSCLFNNTNLEYSPGGWCYILNYKNYEKIDYGYEDKTTNNRMELTAVIKGLEALKEKCDVDFYSDSQYVLKALSEYLENWKAKEFNKKNSKIKNLDLWKKLDKLIQEKVNIATYTWIKGHDKQENNSMILEHARKQNNRCDFFAREKAKEMYKNMTTN